VFWIGLNEIFLTKNWVQYAPHFLDNGALVVALVIFHGVMLCACGVSLVFNYYRRVGAAVLSLVILQVVLTLLIRGGYGKTIFHDIILLGLSLFVLLKTPVNKSNNIKDNI